MKHLQLFEEFSGPGPISVLSLKTLDITPFVQKNLAKIEKFNSVRPQIEEKGKKLFPANEMVKKNPEFKKTPEYRDLKDKEDAFDHQLASAFASSLFGPDLSKVIGYANEIKGGARMFFKGGSSQGIEKFKKFTSGWTEDNANNAIGVQIGNLYPYKDLEFYSPQVLKNIESGNYYDSTGKKKGKSPQKKVVPSTRGTVSPSPSVVAKTA